MQNPQHAQHMELRTLHKHGSWRNVEAIAQNLLDDPEVGGIIVSFRDITDRKQAESAVQDKERYFRALTENSLDAVAVLDEDGSIRYQSPSHGRLLGYEVGKQVGKSGFGSVHPDDLPNIAEAFARLTQSPGAHARAEMRCQHKDGSWRDIEAVGRNLLEDPAVRGIVINFRDVTERKQAELELMRSKELLRVLVENSPDTKVVLNRDGSIRYKSSSFERMAGAKRSDGSPLEFVHPDDSKQAAEDFARLIRNPGAALHTEIRGRHRDGSWRTFEVVGTNLMENPAVAGIVANFRDVTASKLAAEALKQSEAKLRLYLEMSPDAIYIHDLKGAFLYGNRAVEDMIGYRREEVIGHSFLELGLLPPEYIEKAARNLELNAVGRPTGPDEFQLLKKDGSRVSVEISSLPTGSGEDTEIIGIARDVTERKRLEQQLQLAGRLAAVGELAAGVAHELNNPLAAIQAYAQFLSERNDLDQSARMDVSTIYNEARRASKITSNLLSFSHQREPEKSLISINEAIEQSLDLHAYQLTVSNINVDVHLDPDLPQVMADFHQMQQVFVNIISNAEQSMTEAHGGGKLLIETRMSDETIHILFSDDGPGIPPENITRVFDPFFTTKEVGKGTGLGLSICYGIVRNHGGQMFIGSKPGQGAVVTVEIPAIRHKKTMAEKDVLAQAPHPGPQAVAAVRPSAALPGAPLTQTRSKPRAGPGADSAVEGGQ